MIFIGIDLAWTYKNETGLCIMNDSGDVLRHEAAVFSNEELTDIVLSYRNDTVCVGIDAAIVVNNYEGSRAAEGMMMRDRFHGHRLQAFNSNRKYLIKAFGDIRGECIWQMIKLWEPQTKVTDIFGSGCVRLMEVFPTGVCLGMFPELYPLKYKLKGKVPFEETKSEMRRLYQKVEQIQREEGITGVRRASNADMKLMKKKGYKHIEDMMDAFLCAYAMYAIYKGRAEQRIYGDEENGFMIVPVRLADS